MLLKFINKNNRSIFLLWLVGGITMFLLPLSGIEAGFTWADKVVHTGYFFLMFIITALTFKVEKYKLWLWLVLYVLVVEIIQHFFIIGRGYQVGDILAGLVGLLLASLIIYYDNTRN